MADPAQEGSGSSSAQHAPTSPIEVVEAFLAALERLDLDAAMELASEDVVYQNVPFRPAYGKRAARRDLDAMARLGDGLEVRVHNIAQNGDVVLVERTDIARSGSFAAAFWVCGTFEVRDGKIVLWRDRFDFADFTFAMLKGAAGALRALAAR